MCLTFEGVARESMYVTGEAVLESSSQMFLLSGIWTCCCSVCGIRRCGKENAMKLVQKILQKSAMCPKGIKEIKVKMGAEKDWSYAQDVKRLERGDKMVAVQKELEQEINEADQNLSKNK